jgi:hypothetical protein
MVVSGVRGLWQGGNQYIPQPLIVLNDASPSATYLLSAYCAEFHKDNPSPASQFVVWPPDSATACILSNASNQGLSVSATQAAEWINTDRVTFNDLQAKFPVSFPDWNAALQVASQCQQAQVPLQLGQAQPTVPSVQYNAPVTNLTQGTQPVSFRVFHGTFSGGHDGILTISPDRISFEETGAEAHRSDNFDAQCSAIKDAAIMHHHIVANVLNQGAAFYIRTRSRRYDYYAASQDDMYSLLRAISHACPQIPGPGK